MKADYAQSMIYTELSSLNQITQQGRENQDDALKSVAQQFESMFIRSLLKSMRDANDVLSKDNFLNSNTSKFYRDMFDDQLSLNLTQRNGVGIADMLYRQLNQSYGEDFSDETAGNLGAVKDIKRYFGSQMYRAQSDRDEASTHSDISLSQSQAFVSSVYPHLQAIAKEAGFDPDILMAQAALETGWGQHMIKDEQGENSFNLFGIKADHRWQGDKVQVSTTEYRQGMAVKENAYFRRYDSYADSVKDYVQFISENPRYQTAIEYKSKPKEYIQALQEAGYATDPQYANKVIRVSDGESMKDALSPLNP